VVGQKTVATVKRYDCLGARSTGAELSGGKSGQGPKGQALGLKGRDDREERAS
jgi:hypothetical protein